MGVPSRENGQTKTQIFERDNPDNFLDFQFIPEYDDSLSADYSDEEVSGAAISRPQFSKGQSREVSMELLFSDTEGVKYPPGNRYSLSETSLTAQALGAEPVGVERKIRWLQDRMRPAHTSTSGWFSSGFEDSPPILGIVGIPGSFDLEIFTCVLTDMDIERTILHPHSKCALRAFVDVTFKEYVSVEETKNRMNRVEQAPNSTNSRPPDISGTEISQFASGYGQEQEQAEQRLQEEGLFSGFLY